MMAQALLAFARETNPGLRPGDRFANSFRQRRLWPPAEFVFRLAAVEAKAGIDTGLGEVVLDCEPLP